MDRKNLEKIYKMTQSELKQHAIKCLKTKFDNVVAEDGFVYAKGSVPVLLVAHMDTVHRQPVTKIVYADNGNRISSPQGIGGDDRNGVAIIFEIIKELNCSVLLCEDEEIGGVGAHKFVDATYKRTDENGNEVEEKYIEHLDVNYMVEFDRRGNNDAVFYSCDNTDFIDFVEDMTNFKFARGSFSDISVLAPAAKIAAVNLSCGYYNAHTTAEYVKYDEMMDTVEAAKSLIKEKCDKPFEYVEKKYEYPKWNGNRYCNMSMYYPDDYCNDGYSYGGNLFDQPSKYKDERLAIIAQNDIDLELEVVVLGLDMCEETIVATGETKAECWMNLFLENPKLCFNDIQDYSWG